jgi:hypothetical protein
MNVAVNFTYDGLYQNLRNNLCYIKYAKDMQTEDADVINTHMGIKCTLNDVLIPEDQQHRLLKIIHIDTMHRDSDESFGIIMSESEHKQHIPDWIKVYSLSYKMWINIEIAKIEEFKILNG